MIAQVVEMEKIVEQGLLYDFYGELLTEHQRRIYEDVVFGDLSPSEIAGEPVSYTHLDVYKRQITATLQSWAPYRRGMR